VVLNGPRFTGEGGARRMEPPVAGDVATRFLWRRTPWQCAVAAVRRGVTKTEGRRPTTRATGRRSWKCRPEGQADCVGGRGEEGKRLPAIFWPDNEGISACGGGRLAPGVGKVDKVLLHAIWRLEAMCGIVDMLVALAW